MFSSFPRSPVNLPSHSELADACVAADGRLVEFGIHLKCSGNGAKVEILVEDDDCIPNACSEEEVAQEIEIIEKELEDAYESALVGTGGSCTVDVSAAPVSCFGSFFSSTVTALLLVIVLGI